MRQVTPDRELRFELLDDIAALRHIQSEWRTLLEASSSAEAMQDPAWALAWWKHYGTNRSLAVGVVRNGPELVGLAPMCRRRFTYRAGIPFQRLELMGSSGAEADGVCGEYLGWIAKAGHESDVAAAFSAALAEGKFGYWDECVLEQIDGNSAMLSPLVTALTAEHERVSRELSSHAYYLPLPADWNAFLANLPGKRRNWFRRTMKDFSAWVGDAGYTLERAKSLADVQNGMRILADLHAERWRSEGQDGVFSSERFMAFHEEFAATIFEAGQLDLLWLVVAGVPVAAHYSFVRNGKVYFYQSGRKSGAPANVRLGIVMFVLALQDAMARGLKEYDFLAGDSRYKSQFTSETRPLYEIRVVRSMVRDTLLQALRQSARAARKFYATLTPPG